MYIEDKRVMANDTFGKLRDGDCFTFTDCDEEIVCMKVCLFDDKDDCYFRAINLDGGVEISASLTDDTPVQKVNARVTIW